MHLPWRLPFRQGFGAFSEGYQLNALIEHCQATWPSRASRLQFTLPITCSEYRPGVGYAIWGTRRRWLLTRQQRAIVQAIQHAHINVPTGSLYPYRILLI